MGRKFTEGYNGREREIRVTRIFPESWREDLKKIFEEQLEKVISVRSSDTGYNEEILRMKISSMMSLYDYTIHEIVKYRLVEIVNNGIESEINEPTNFSKFKISIKTLQECMKKPNELVGVLSKDIESQINTYSYINFNEFRKLMKILTDENIVKNYLEENEINDRDFEKKFSELVKRRNAIVHKLDIADKMTIERESITEEEVNEYIEFLKKFVIYILVNI